MAKPMSWKWKVFLAFVISILTITILAFTNYGQDAYEDYIYQAYKDTPEDERRDSPWAARYLSLAYFRGAVCGNTKESYRMYKDFLGINVDKEGKDFTKSWILTGKYVSPDGRKGWGPMHPDAVDAFSDYIELYDPENSAQFTATECILYYRLFYQWMLEKSPDHKPHPKFRKHWPKIMNLIKKARLNNMDIDWQVPKAPDYFNDVDATPGTPAAPGTPAKPGAPATKAP